MDAKHEISAGDVLARKLAEFHAGQRTPATAHQLLQAQAGPAAGTTERAPAAAFDEEGVRRQAAADWDSKPAVRAEFRHSGKTGYVALCVAEAKGIAKKAGGTVLTAHINDAGDRHGTAAG